jgi:hypothetical protein
MGPDADQATVSLSERAAAAIERCSSAVSLMRINVDLKPEGPTAWVKGSETLLSQMVTNVIDNAVKHNQPGGWIRVATTVDGSQARLVVENGGAVLAQDDLTNLARPFRRLGTERTRSEKGSGLGLSIVEAIAESHSGTLHLHARPAGGLEVIVALPLASAPAAGSPT